ncbi:MAG: hypothetical protein WEE89_08125 [Gemmatimonadota bacterium]
MTARYDRLAPLESPNREHAFPGWSVFRDLEGIERDADAGRRARLRFLALRPAYRLVARGFGGVPADSFDRQIDRVREELGQLPSRDQERSALAALLNELRSREPQQSIVALLAVSEFCEANGQFAAAEEYARVSLDLARRSREFQLSNTATRSLARIALAAGSLELAGQRAQEACDHALATDDRGEWIRSIGELAATYRGTGDPSLARDALLQALKRAREWGNDALIGLAFAQLCRHSAESGQAEAVVEYGWSSLRVLERNEDRAQVLTLMGAALNSLGLTRAADRCYSLVTMRANSPALRVVGLAGGTLIAAEVGDRDRYRERRTATMRELGPAHRAARAAAHLELGRAAFVVGDHDTAREHLRETLALLGPHGATPTRVRAEEVLRALEQRTAPLSTQRSSDAAPDQARRIAAELEHLADSLVIAE